jgi:4-diphosphocytidyl-2-C-methyl-D-erythritol kinase
VPSATANGHAKVNLCLYVTGKRPDGLHTLDGVVIPIALHDVVTVTEAAAVSATFSGACAAGLDPENNTAVRAATLLIAETRCPPVRIEVEKNIPQGAGLGGSSADAAGVLRAAGTLFGIPDAVLFKIAARAGGDVPAQLLRRPCRVRGTGERLTPFSLPKPLHVLIDPGTTGVGTAACFALFDALGAGDGAAAPARLTPPLPPDALMRLLSTFAAPTDIPQSALHNELEPAATRLCPDITARKNALARFSRRLFLTGSGSAVCALIDDPAALGALPNPYILTRSL